MSTEQGPLRSTELPADFAHALRGMTERGDPPETLADAVDAFDRHWKTTGVQLSVDQLFQPEPTRHAVDLGDRVEHVPCVLDALIAGLLLDPTGAEIRSQSPIGEDTITLSLTDEGVEVAPASAVFSFGVEAAESERAEVSVARLGESDSAVLASCSYINAFPDVPAYEQWAAELSNAHAVAVGIDALLAFARIAAGEWVVVDSGPK